MLKKVWLKAGYEKDIKVQELVRRWLTAVYALKLPEAERNKSQNAIITRFTEALDEVYKNVKSKNPEENLLEELGNL